MKCKIMATEIKWASTNDEPIFCEFAIFRKGLFGGLKEVKEYEGSYLSLHYGKDGEIDLNYVFLTDGNFQEMIFDPRLVISILEAAILKLSESGDKDKAQLLRTASIGVFKKYILKK